VAKVTRDRLSRGAKLLTQHTHAPLTSIATELNTSNVQAAQIQNSMAPFRVTYHIPWIGSDFPRAADENNVWGVPFILPPLQEFFSVSTDASGVRTGEISDTTPNIVLDEISFSFEQRGEPAAVVDGFWPTPLIPTAAPLKISADEGNLDYQGTGAYDIRVALLEKTQWFFDSNVYEPESEVVSFNLPPVAFSGDRLRLNPFIMSDISKAINPFKTYILTIHCPGLSDFQTPRLKTYALPSIIVSMRFLHPLVPRDAPSNNSPTPVASPGPQITIDSPTGGVDDINADDSDGLSTNIEIVDDVFSDGLRCGYGEFGDNNPLGHLDDDACYEVLVVPLYQGKHYSGVIADSVDGEAWRVNVTDPLIDRRIIPLSYPMTIHGCYLAWNWQRWLPADRAGPVAQTAATVPNSVTLSATVGVGIGSGLRSDDYKYSQINSLALSGGPETHSNVNWSSNRAIDRIRISENPAGRAAAPLYDWDIFEMSPGGVGTGYYDPPTPEWVGNTWTPTSKRDTGFLLDGIEQFIEVRMSINDANDLNVAGAGNAGDIYVGYQGHFVYIIGKKHLVSADPGL
jgi:hypothetical protein